MSAGSATPALPPPDCARKAAHQRSIVIHSYEREDGLWDIEGHLRDARTEDIPVATRMLPAGEAIHSMWLRLTVDRTATIVAVQAATAAAPYDEGCGSIAPDYTRLVGVRVQRGYRDAIRKLFGRTAGCTHMNELALVMGSAALQALWPVFNTGESHTGIDGCHALRADGPQVARFFPRWYRPAGQ